MNHAILERLLDRIGEMEDSFLEEAETADIAHIKAVRRKRIAKYSAYGAAGAAVLGGAFAAYWRLRSNRMGKSA